MNGEPIAGDRLEHLALERAWLVDPVAGREGFATLEVDDGRITRLEWHDDPGERSEAALLVVPGMTDLHTHLREPGPPEGETITTGLRAAARGGFTTVCAMANTAPAIDDAAAVAAAHEAARASRSPVRLRQFAATTAGGSGAGLAPIAALADAGAAGFSDDGSPVADAVLLRSALLLAGAHGLPVVEHAEDTALTAGAEANEGLAATILGLRGAPAAGEAAAVARTIAILADAVRVAPADSRPRLHLTHLSLAASIDLVRMAKAASLPITCDVTPHHLALHDGWLAGDRRYAWVALDDAWSGRVDVDAYDPATRVNPPLRSAADACALADGLRDGTVDAIATDHAPHRDVDKDVEFGDAANGISGIETALPLLLEAVTAGHLPLLAVVRALTAGPVAVLGTPPPGFAVGSAADLVVIDLAAPWTVTRDALLSRGRNTPLTGLSLGGRVVLTVADGTVAYTDGTLG
jgi:dihydroorotase